MKIRLLTEARIRHNAGEVVEASPDEAGFLISTGCAVALAPAARRETPEEKSAVSAVETRKTVKKTLKK